MTTDRTGQSDIQDAETRPCRHVDGVEQASDASGARRTRRGTLAGRLDLSTDWDSREVNEGIARDFGTVES